LDHFAVVAAGRGDSSITYAKAWKIIISQVYHWGGRSFGCFWWYISWGISHFAANFCEIVN